MSEKRNHLRFSFKNNIFLKLESDPVKTIESQILDISFTGLSFFLNENVNINTMVEFDVSCFAGKHLVGRGKVVHISQHILYAQNGFKIGLEFIEVNKEIVLNTINRIVSTKILEQKKKEIKITRSKKFFDPI